MGLESKMVIRVTEDWHRKVKAEAALRGMTISNLIRQAVDDWLKRNPLELDKKDS